MGLELYAVVSKERLQSILETFHEFTGLSLRLLDDHGNILHYYGNRFTYCSLLQKHIFVQNECANLHFNAGLRALDLGEAYIFTCHADLNHIAFPFAHDGRLLGIVIAGPFLMDAPDSTLIHRLMESKSLSPTLALELYDQLTTLPIMTPARVQQLKKIMDHLLSPLLPLERLQFQKTQEKMYQQARISETIQLYKGQGLSSSRQFFREKESMLLTKVRTGSLQEAKALLNELIGYVLFSEGGHIESVRIHAIELTTLLSRVAMDGGARTDSIYSLNSQFLTLISMEQNMEELCYLLQDVVESFVEAMFSSKDKGNQHIRHALRYMADNYSQPLTLGQVAESVGLTENYFSSLFHKTVGISFREHLARIRIEESKRLLLSTDVSLTDIAVSMGFTDQSHYCKVFKRMVGMTPGQYRNR